MAPKARIFASLLWIAAATTAILSFAPHRARADWKDVEENEETVFDVFLSDVLSGTILVRYNQDTYEIVEPDDLIPQLKDVKDPEKLKALVSGPIERERTLPGIGTVKFSSETFRVILTPDPALLKNVKLEIGEVIHPEKLAENSLSFRTDLGGNYTGDFGPAMNTSLFHRTSVSYANFYTLWSGIAVTDQSYDINEASASVGLGRYQLSTGLLRAFSGKFIGGADIAGATLRTSDRLIANDLTLRGSVFQVFIPSRARVKFFRGNELISVQMLDYGLRDIDTSNFPQGSYAVDITIEELKGGITQDRKFFTNYGLLALRGYPALALDVGVLRDRTRLLDSSVYQLSGAVRAFDFLQLQSSVGGTEDLTIGSAGFLGLWNDQIFGFDYGVSSESEYGYAAQASGILFGINYGLDYTQSTGSSAIDSRNVGQPEPPPVMFPDLALEQANRQFNLLRVDRTNLRSYIFKQYGDFQFRLRADRSESEDDESHYAYGPSLLWRVASDAKRTINLELGEFKTEDGDKVALSLLFQYRLGNYTLGDQTSIQSAPDKQQILSQQSLSYLDTLQSGTGTTATAQTELDAGDEIANGLFSGNLAQIRQVGRYTDLTGGLLKRTFRPEDKTYGNATASTAVIYKPADGALISYPPSESSILVVEITSKSTNTPIDLLVNGAVYGRVPAGGTLAVGLPIYRKYKIGIAPSADAELVRYDQTEYDLILFPENVVKKTWNVERVFIGVGRIVDKDGNPIVREHLKGLLDYVVTEGDGSFQAELSGYEDLAIESKRRSCKIRMPRIETPKYLHDYKTLRCE